MTENDLTTLDEDLDVPDDLSPGGGNFLDVECWAHVQVTGIDARPEKSDGGLISNAKFKIHLGVLTADVPNQDGRTVGEVFFNPDKSSKDGGKFAKKKVGRLALALGLVKLGQSGTTRVAWSKSIGQQFICHFRRGGKEGDDRRFIEIAFADMYHVDDPAKANVPRVKEMVDQIAPEFRWTAAEIAEAKKQPAPDGTPATHSEPVAAAATATAAAANGEHDIDEL